MDTPETSPAPLLPAHGETVPAQNRRGCLWLLAGALGCLGVLLLIPLIAIVFGFTSVGLIAQNVQGMFSGAPLPAAASVVSSQTLLVSMQPLGQLVTVSVQLAQADIQVTVQQGTGNLCGFSANHVAQGTIEAGIDFATIHPENITYQAESNTYTVTLPAPQLTSCRLDYIRQYDRSTTLCAVDWDEARLLANYTALLSFRDDALEGGVLTRAQQQTQVVVEGFVRSLTAANVEVVFETAPAPLPVSCQPQAPQGWTQDANGGWLRPGG